MALVIDCGGVLIMAVVEERCMVEHTAEAKNYRNLPSAPVMVMARMRVMGRV